MTELSIEQIQGVAQSLRDDPTFEKMSASVLDMETRYLLKAAGLGAEVANIRIVKDYASLLESTPVALGVRVRSHLPPAPLNQNPVELPEAPEPTRHAIVFDEATNITEAMWTPARQTVPLLYHVKIATGIPDAALADLLAMKRSTVQACVAGRLAESFTETQLMALKGYLTGRARAIETLMYEQGWL